MNKAMMTAGVILFLVGSIYIIDSNKSEPLSPRILNPLIEWVFFLIIFSSTSEISFFNNSLLM